MYDMKTTAKAIKDYEFRFADELRDYTKQLKHEYRNDPDKARQEARQALLRTGVLKE